MSTLIKKLKALLKSMTIVHWGLAGILGLAIILLSVFIGFEYIPVIGFIALFYWFSSQAQKDRFYLPKERAAKEARIAGLKREMDVIEAHIAETNELEAKLRLEQLKTDVAGLEKELEGH